MLIRGQRVHLVLGEFDTSIWSAPVLLISPQYVDIRNTLDQLRLMGDLAALIDGRLLRPEHTNQSRQHQQGDETRSIVEKMYLSSSSAEAPDLSVI